MAGVCVCAGFEGHGSGGGSSQIVSMAIPVRMPSATLQQEHPVHATPREESDCS